jgi:hypothetical protein
MKRQDRLAARRLLGLPLHLHFCSGALPRDGSLFQAFNYTYAIYSTNSYSYHIHLWPDSVVQSRVRHPCRKPN